MYAICFLGGLMSTKTCVSRAKRIKRKDVFLKNAATPVEDKPPQAKKRRIVPTLVQSARSSKKTSSCKESAAAAVPIPTISPPVKKIVSARKSTPKTTLISPKRTVWRHAPKHLKPSHVRSLFKPEERATVDNLVPQKELIVRKSVQKPDPFFIGQGKSLGKGLFMSRLRGGWTKGGT